jgi:hypothetical protein
VQSWGPASAGLSAVRSVCLPKFAQPGAKAALAEIWTAEDREHAEAAARAFAAGYGTKWPKAAVKIIDGLDVLLAFYDYPAEHWIHLRTTNPIESTFATVRLRQRITKGPGSRAASVAMAFKLIESAQARWRALNAPHLVALVRAGAPVLTIPRTGMRSASTRRCMRRRIKGSAGLLVQASGSCSAFVSP